MEVEFEINDLSVSQKLNKLPKLIYEQELKVNALSTKIEGLKAKIDALKTILIGNIISEKDFEGKPKYKNEESRNSELFIRLNQDDSFIEYKKELDIKLYDITQEQSKLRYLNNIFNGARSLSRINNTD